MACPSAAAMMTQILPMEAQCDVSEDSQGRGLEQTQKAQFHWVLQE